MKNIRTFVSATHANNLQVICKFSYLHNPGREGLSPFGGFRMVSLPPGRASLFKKKRHHDCLHNPSTPIAKGISRKKNDYQTRCQQAA